MLTLFFNTIPKMLTFFHCVNIHIDGAKAIMGKNAGTLVWNSAVASKNKISHCILNHYALTGKKNSLTYKCPEWSSRIY